MAQRPDLPVDGTTITSAWGTTVREQIVTPFSTTGTRSSEIGSPISGQVSTLTAGDATNGIYVYNGTAWRKDWSSPWGIVGRAVSSATQNLTATTYADLTGLSAASVPLIANRYYRATLSLSVAQPVFSTTGTDQTLSLRVTNGAGTAYATLPDLYVRAVESTGYCATATFTTTAGAVTVKAQYKITGTASIFTAGASFQCELVIEDLGPSGAPT